MIRVGFLVLFIFSLNTQLSAQVMLGVEESDQKMLSIGSESSIFYGSEKFGVTEFVTNDEYILVYSENKLAFFLIDKFDKQILDEFKIYKKLKLKKGKEKGNIIIDGKDTIYQLKSLDIPVNFKSMQFINDSTISAGVFFNKYELEHLFLTISNKKLGFYTQALDMLSYYEPEVSKKEKRKVFDFFEMFLFHKIYAVKNNQFIILEDTISPFKQNRKTFGVSAEVVLKSDNTYKRIYKDTLSRKNLKLMSSQLNLFQVYNDILVHYKVRENKYCFYDFEGRILFESSIKDTLDAYHFTYQQVGYFPKYQPQLIKNNFTNQLYCIYEKVKKSATNRYNYFFSIFEVKIDLNIGQVYYQFVKDIVSNSDITPKEVVNNQLIYTLKKQKQKYLYKTNLFNSRNIEQIKTDYTSSIIEPIDEDYPFLNHKYYRPKQRLLTKIYGEQKELTNQYPNQTIEELITSLIKLYQSYRLDYINLYLSVASKEELEEIYDAINKGQISSTYISSLYDEIKHNCKKSVNYARIMLENYEKGYFKNLSKTIIKIPISKEKNTETYAICVRLKGKYYLYGMFKDNETD